MKRIIMIILCLFSMAQMVHAQCYTKMMDASGIEVSAGDLKMLEDASCALKNMFSPEFSDQISIVDIGFYSQNENMTGGYLEFMELAISELAQNPHSKYYVLIGRQSDSKGIYTKFYVDVKLPNITEGKCQNNIDESAKNLLFAKIEDNYNAHDRSYLYASESIAKGLDALTKYLNTAKQCCKDGGDVSKCIRCDSDNLYTNLVAQGFERTKIENIGKYPNNIAPNIIGVEDYSKLLFTINKNSVVDIPNSYRNVVDTFKQKGLNIHVFITQDADACTSTWDNIEEIIKSQKYDIVYWHHIFKGNGSTQAYLFVKTFYKIAPLGRNVPTRTNSNSFIDLLSLKGSKIANNMVEAMSRYLSDDNIEICDYGLALDKALSDDGQKYFNGLYKIYESKNIERMVSSSMAKILQNTAKNNAYMKQEASRDFFYNMSSLFVKEVENIESIMGNLVETGIDKNLSNKALKKLKTLIYHPTFKEDGFSIGEFPNLNAYREYMGNMELTTAQWNEIDCAWLESDRVNKTPKWDKCMEAITKNRWEDRWNSYTDNYLLYSYVNAAGFVKTLKINQNIKVKSVPFGVVNGYYCWVQHKMDLKYPNTNFPNQPGKSKWATGASYLVSSLEQNYARQDKIVGESSLGELPSILGITNDLLPILIDLNIGIANFAVKKFNDALYRNDKVEWYFWDRDFIRNEQVTTVALDVYKKYKDEAILKTMDDFVQHKGFVAGSAAVKLKYYEQKPIPAFSLFADCHVDKILPIPENNWAKNYGEAGRYHIPLLMLYKEYHITNDNIASLIGKDNVDAYQKTPVPFGFPSCQTLTEDQKAGVELSFNKILLHYQTMRY